VSEIINELVTEYNAEEIRQQAVSKVLEEVNVA